MKLGLHEIAENYLLPLAPFILVYTHLTAGTAEARGLVITPFGEE